MRHQRRPGGPGGSEVAVTGFRRLKCAQFSVVIAARSNQVVNSREEPPTTPYKVPMTAHAAWRTSTSSRQGNRQQHNHSKRMATLEFECHGHPLSPKAGLQKPACKCHPRAWPTLARKEPRPISANSPSPAPERSFRIVVTQNEPWAIQGKFFIGATKL